MGYYELNGSIKVRQNYIMFDPLRSVVDFMGGYMVGSLESVWLNGYADMRIYNVYDILSVMYFC